MFEWLFKYPRSDFNTGELIFTSGYSVWLFVFLLLVAVVIIGISLWRRKQHLSTPRLGVIWFLHSAIAAILLCLLWQPVLKVKSLVAGENSIALLLDNSASMNYQSNDVSRRQTAMELIEQVADPLSDNFDLEYGTIGNELSWQENLQQLPPPSNRSRITSSVLEALDQARKDPLAAIVVVSDGSDNSSALFDPDTATGLWDKLTTFGVPIHTIGVGRETLEEDSEITGVDLATTTLPGSVERATLTLRHGSAGNARIKVYDGDNIIALHESTLPTTPGQTSINLDIPATEAGLQELHFELEPQAGDTVQQNNSRRRLLQVEEKERRILYFEGEPRWEYKFIRRAADLSEGVSLATILRTTPNKFYRQGIDNPQQHADGFPKTKADLYNYDALIIGNVESISLDASQQQLIHDYVSERGGTLLMLAGNHALSDGGWHNSPVATALPVTLEKSASPTFERVRVKAQLTATGSTSPVTRLANDPDKNLRDWNELPEVADFQRTGQLKPGATVLLEVDTTDGTYPLLARQRYGAGNTFVMATSGSWRWQMQLPSEDQRHEIFWQQLLQAISATSESRLTLTSNKQIYLDETAVTVTARVLDEEFNPLTTANVAGTITAPDGTSQITEFSASAEAAGSYVATITAPATGNWQVDVSASQDGEQIANDTRWFHREDGTAESYGLAQNSDFLKRLSAATGGQYWTGNTINRLPEAIRAAGSGILRQQNLPLWNAPFFFLLLLGLKLFEWVLRLLWGRL